jgi:hypothetical protein
MSTAFPVEPLPKTVNRIGSYKLSAVSLQPDIKRVFLYYSSTLIIECAAPDGKRFRLESRLRAAYLFRTSFETLWPPAT